MQIVIDIPEEVKNRLCFGVTYSKDIQVVCEALNDGTSLPKGHGRLIDADELYDSLIFPTEQFGNTFKEILDDASTIIEAESEDCPAYKPKYCDRNICIQNEYNGIGCDECEVTKSQEPCEDAISRQAAENLFRNARAKLDASKYKKMAEFNLRDSMLLNAEQLIHLLPPVHAEQKIGHWIWNDTVCRYVCDKCGESSGCGKEWLLSGEALPNYCPNCGARMDTHISRKEK